MGGPDWSLPLLCSLHSLMQQSGDVIIEIAKAMVYTERIYILFGYWKMYSNESFCAPSSGLFDPYT